MMKLVVVISLMVLLYMQDEKQKELEIATLGAGCFWCTEAIFERVEGVMKVEPGFSGGHIKNPAYKEVVSGRTGHAEVVQITFNPAVISYPEILEIYWKTHDPTQLNRQGNDVGTQYRSVIFFHSEAQEQHAEKLLEKLEELKIWQAPIVTVIEEFDTFYPAEDYHNDYYKYNADQGYCKFVITPKIEKFENAFKDYLKQK